VIAHRVLPAVERLLGHATYAEISVEQIAEEAGISRSSFYNYFEDKGDLLRVLTEDVVGELIEAARAWWDLPASASKAEVRAALSGLVDVYRRHELLMAAVVETTTYDDRVRERFGAMMRTAADGVATHIRAGQKDGVVHPDLDAERVAAWLTWMTERGLLTLVAGSDAAAGTRLLDALTEIVWNTLYEGMR
jgi:AcrR family transcriptional regulator